MVPKGFSKSHASMTQEKRSSPPRLNLGDILLTLCRHISEVGSGNLHQAEFNADYLVAFSTPSVNSERPLKRPSLKTSEIGISQPKIKTLTELLSLPDGKTREGDQSWALHFSAGNSQRKAANYLLNHSRLWGCAHHLQGNRQILLWNGSSRSARLTCRITISFHSSQNKSGSKLSFFIPSSYYSTRNSCFCSSSLLVSVKRQCNWK